MSREEQELILKCRVEDVNIKGNQLWKYEDISCPSGMKNVDEAQSHTLFCEYM